jgi:hypothetical protein
MKSLYTYVICASVKPSETGKEKVEKLGDSSTLSSSQKSSSLGSDKKSYEPYIMWKFPEEVPKFDSKVVEFCFPDPNYYLQENKKNGYLKHFLLIQGELCLGIESG